MKTFEIKRSKQTRRGMIYLVRNNRTNKWVICGSVSDNCIATPECQGKYDYVLKQWNQNFGKERFYPLVGSTE
jgi:hypothetical protein